jgi:hypothetical protein
MEQKTTLRRKIALVLAAAYLITVLAFLFLTVTNFWGD